MDDEEFLETSTINADQQSPSENNNRPEDLLKEGVIRLFDLSEKIKITLQKAALEENPVLSDPNNLEKAGIKSNVSHDFLLSGIKRGLFNISCSFRYPQVEEEPTVIKMEELPIDLISLSNVGFEFDPSVSDFANRDRQYGERFVDGNAYELVLQGLYPGYPESDNRCALMYSFYMSKQGDWVKRRRVDPAIEPTKIEFDVKYHDLEIAAGLLQILESRVENVLSSSEQH